MERLCLDCQKPVKGRTDKKFCDDICRSNFNNFRKAEDQESIKHINQILKRNRKILMDKSPNGKTKIKRETLIRIGFNFEYHTHLYANKNGDTYFFCYEYGYLNLNNGEILVVKREKGNE